MSETPANIAEAVERLAETYAEAYRRACADPARIGSLLLPVFESYLAVVGTAVADGEASDAVTSAASRALRDVLRLCEEIAGTPSAPSTAELAVLAGRAMDAHMNAGAVPPWLVEHSLGVLDRLEAGLHLDPPQRTEAAARAHARHARLLDEAGLPHAALAYSERAAELHPVAELLGAHLDRLIALDRHEEAAALSERQLSALFEADPPDRPAIARALDRRREILRRTGEEYGVTVAAEEAVTGWRRAAEHAEPGAYARELIDALTAQAAVAHGLGRESPAADAMLDAVRIASAEVAAGRDLRTEAADAMARLVGQLIHADRLDEARDWSQRELDMLSGRMRAGRTMPAAYARALNNRAVVLNAFEEYAESLELTERAALIQEALFRTDGDEAESYANTLLTRQAAFRELREYEHAIVCCHRAVAILMDLAEKRPGFSRAKTAFAHRNYARLLSLTGDPLALNANRYVLARYEELEAEHPGRFRRDVAEALNLVLVAFDNAGAAPSERLPYSERLVALEEELAAARPGRTTELAQALHNHGATLAEAGRADDAVEYSARAVEVYLRLPAAEREEMPHRANLANCLEGHAAHLAGVGRTEAALDFSTQALAAYVRLLDDDRHLNLPQAARALENHAGRLAALERHEEAAEHSTRAALLFEELLAEGNPAVRRDLATTLSNLADRLTRTGRVPEAFTAAERALRIREDLAAGGAPERLADLGTSLLNTAHLFFEHGDQGTGVSYSSRSIALFADLVETDRQAYLPLLGQTLHNHAEYLAKIDRHGEAAGYADRAVAVREELTAERGEAYLEDLTDSLHWAWEYHRASGAAGAARAHLVRREDLLGVRYETDPGVLPALVEDRLDLARTYTDAGEYACAVPVARRAVEAARDLAGEDPGRIEFLECCLAELASALRHIDPGAAYAVAEECLAVAERRDADDGGYGLAHALDACADILAGLGRHAEAVAYADRALPLWEELADPAEPGSVADLASCLTCLAPSLSALGRRAEALVASERAVALAREAYEADRDLREDLAHALRARASVLTAAGMDGAGAAAMEAVAHYGALAEDVPARFLPELAEALMAAVGAGAPDADGLRARAQAARRAAEKAGPDGADRFA